MDYPTIINGTYLLEHIKEIPELPLKLYLVLSVRLSRINYAYRVWRTNIVIYSDNELKKSLGISMIDLRYSRAYLIETGLVEHYEEFMNNSYYHLRKPANCASLKYKPKKSLKDKKLSIRLKVLPEFDESEFISLSFALKKWRFIMEITQKVAAKKLSVPLGTYRHWEQGDNLPGEMNMIKLQTILNQFGTEQLEEL